MPVIEGSCLRIDNHHCALLLDRLEVKGSVFLTDGFSATGRVSLDNARITVSLECGYAVLDGKAGPSLTAAGMVVDGRFVFRELSSPANGVWLCSSHVGYLVDDEKSWGRDIILDGFRYDNIAEVAPTDAQMRLNWLRKQRRSNWESAQDFKPQPWEQVIRALNAMGHGEDARLVGIAREDHLRQIGRIDNGMLRCLHWTFGKLAAYGYRPMRLVYSMLVVWFGCALFFSAAAERGVFAPTNPLIFRSNHYAHCSPVYQPGQYQHPKEKFGNWFLCPDLPEEYTGFSPWVYSLDLLLPVVDLQQERDWAPLIPTPRPNLFRELTHLTFKHWTRLLMWFEILFGWFASLLLIAVLTGLANRGKD